MATNNYPSDSITVPEIWTAISIINNVPDFLYFIDKEGHLITCNDNFRMLLNLESDFTDLPYMKLAKALDLTDYEIGEIQKDDFTAIFTIGEKQKRLCVGQEKDNPRVFKFHRQVILGKNNRNIDGLLVTMREEDRVIEKTPQPPKLKPETTLNRAPQVLLVEDNPLAQLVTSALFKAKGCVVDTAENDTEAFPLFESKHYDLIMMDLGLPGSPGRIITKEIRNKEATKGISEGVPIIGITAYIVENVISDCRHYKMNGLLGKPITEQQVIQILDRFVNHKNVDVDGIIYFDDNE